MPATSSLLLLSTREVGRQKIHVDAVNADSFWPASRFFYPAPDIQILMGSLVYLRHGIENSPYRSLLETNQWAEICNIFTRDACALLGLSVESPLSVRFEALALVPLSLPCVGRSSILGVDKCIICSCKCSECHHTCVCLQFCIRLYGFASADEHKAGDWAEAVQRRVDT